MAAASAVVTKAVVSCRPGDLLRDVWSLMKERRLKNIPVLDQHSRPILESTLGEVEYEEDLLRGDVMCVGYH